MNNVKCPECNLTNWSTAISCKRCGLLFVTIDSLPQSEIAESLKEFNDAQPQSLADTAPVDQGWRQHPQNAIGPNYVAAQREYRGSNQKSGLAIASMVLGIVGFALSCIGGFLLAPIGLILGIVALVKANRYPNAYRGKGYSIAGVILCGFLTLAFPVIAAIAVPNLLAARRAANEGSAISTIRTIAGAEEKYRAASPGGNCAELPQLAKSSLIDPVLANGIKSGYRFVMIPTIVGCEIYATPIVSNGFSSTGNRSFFASSEELWQIHAGTKNGLTADRNDPLIENGNTQRPKIATQKAN